MEILDEIFRLTSMPQIDKYASSGLKITRVCFTFLEAPVSMFRKNFVLCGRRIGAFVGLFVITMIAAFSLSGCGGSSSPVSVAVTASAATVDATDTVTLTATITNDQSTNGVADGVTWSVSGGGTLSSQTTTGATYTAPAATRS